MVYTYLYLLGDVHLRNLQCFCFLFICAFQAPGLASTTSAWSTSSPLLLEMHFLFRISVSSGGQHRL